MPPKPERLEGALTWGGGGVLIARVLNSTTFGGVDAVDVKHKAVRYLVASWRVLVSVIVKS